MTDAYLKFRAQLLLLLIHIRKLNVSFTSKLDVDLYIKKKIIKNNNSNNNNNDNNSNNNDNNNNNNRNNVTS